MRPIVGTIRLPPAMLEDARPAMARMILASRAEDGCFEYGYAEDVIDRGLVHVRERWRDADAFERHLRTPHLAQWRAARPALGIGDRDLRRYEVGEPMPA